MASDLQKPRREARSLGRSIALALTIAFYLALIPIVVAFSGPIYHSLKCSFGDCSEPGSEVTFVLETRGPLQAHSTIRLPNGQPIGKVTGFRTTSDERYTYVVGRVDPDYAHLTNADLRCEVAANFNIQMDADLVVSTCPGMDLPALPQIADTPVFVCGGADHFQRMGQEVRSFVLEHVRPGEQPTAARLNGPCGADTEAATSALRAIIAN